MRNFRIMKNSYMPIKGKRPHFLGIAERDANDGVRAIKVGFCWMSFFYMLFGGLWIGAPSAGGVFLWAIIHRLWLIAFTGLIAIYSIYLLFAFAASFVVSDDFNDIVATYEIGEIGEILGYGVRLILAPLLAIIIGFMTNKWRVKAMEKKGYEKVTIIKASSKQQAVDLYLFPGKESSNSPS